MPNRQHHVRRNLSLGTPLLNPTSVYDALRVKEEGQGNIVGSLVGTYQDTDRETLEPVTVGVVNWPAGAKLPAVVDTDLLKPADGTSHDIGRLRRIRRKGHPPVGAVEASEGVNKADVSAALKVLDRDLKRLESRAIKAKGSDAGALFELAGDLANARALLLKANQTGRGRSADDLRAEKGSRTRTEIEGLKEAIAASPLTQHRTAAVARLIELYRRPPKTLEEREMVSKRVATQLLGHAPNHAPGKDSLFNVHNLIDEIGDEAGLKNTDDVVAEARLLGDLQRQVTELERTLPRSTRKRRNPIEPGTVVDVPSLDPTFTVKKATHAGGLFGLGGSTSYKVEVDAPGSNARTVTVDSSAIKRLNPRKRRTGTQSGLFGNNAPYYEEVEARKTEGGVQTGLPFAAEDDFRLAARELTESEEKAANRGRFDASRAQGRLLNPSQAINEMCPWCNRGMHIPAGATKYRHECGALVGVEQ